MKKREVIFYKGHSYPDEPEILELNSGYKIRMKYREVNVLANVIEQIYGISRPSETLVKPTERKIKNFWKKMDELNVWNWEKDYSPIESICDGHIWELHLRNREGKVKITKGFQEYPHNFNQVINALNNLFGSKVKKQHNYNTSKEIIEIRTECYGGYQNIYLENNAGYVDDDQDKTNVKIDEFKKQNFWKKIDELGVWNWHSKYPHEKLEYLRTDATNWKLKMINHDKAKYCSGYDSFPKNFKKFIKELSNLMGVEFKIE
jgi:hypothetical protein